VRVPTPPAPVASGAGAARADASAMPAVLPWQDLAIIAAVPFKIDGQLYLGYSEPMSWAAAREHCRSQGMELASVTSAAQNQALAAAMKAQVVGERHFWVGGTDSAAEGRWAWSDGSAWSYSNWAASEPNGGTRENCVMVYTSDSNAAWNDQPCLDALGFACKAAGKLLQRDANISSGSLGAASTRAASNPRGTRAAPLQAPAPLPSGAPHQWTTSTWPKCSCSAQMAPSCPAIPCCLSLPRHGTLRPTATTATCTTSATLPKTPA
jgi:hypothetical protein